MKIKTSADIVEKNITKAIQKSLRLDVVNYSRITKGEVHKVYKVSTNSGNILLRIFRGKGWVPRKRIEWIEQQFTKHKVPHAKLLYYSERSTYFPYGFMVTEFIDGESCSDAIKNGTLSYDGFHKKLGQLLKKVHSIQLKSFGVVPADNKTKSFLEYILSAVKNTFKELKTAKDLDKNLYWSIETQITALLDSVDKKLKPVLTHGDPSPDNCILTRDNQLILIDWDAVQSSAWLRDYTDLVLNDSHMSSVIDLRERKQIIAKSFMPAHTRVGLTQKEIDNVVQAFEIAITTNGLPYYLITQKNIKAYKKNLESLHYLLNN